MGQQGANLKVIHLVGARSNFMKVVLIMDEMTMYPDEFQQILVYRTYPLTRVCFRRIIPSWKR